jgi:hypothetical protein
MTIEQIYNYRCAEFMYSTRQGKNRILADFLSLNARSHEYDTRRIVEYRQPMNRININKSFFVNNVFKIWDIIPLHVKTCTSKFSFKNKCKKYLLNTI